MIIKKVSESRYTMMHRVFISELNSAGNMHGGFLLRYLDEAAAICALRHARCKLVTAAVEQVRYIAPIYHGDILSFHCSVNYVGTSSLEVGVRIEAEDPMTATVRHTNTAYMIFTGLDASDKPRPLPLLEAETDIDRQRMAEAARRMAFMRMDRQDAKTGSLSVELEQLPGSYTLCRLAPETPVTMLPTPNPASSFFSISRTENELSLILPTSDIAGLPTPLSIENDFICLRVAGSFAINTTGLLSTLSLMLAANRISVFITSTFSTAYLLVHTDLHEKAIAALRSAGHRVTTCKDTQ